MHNPFKRRRTIEEWGRLTSIRVLDPDGFDRKDPHLMERTFTRQEFDAGVALSTCVWPFPLGEIHDDR